jgi:DNA-binding transcriptional LysR family regulator
MLDPDDLRFFLDVARTRRLVATAKNLGVTHTTAGRRINALERALGSRLFDRDPSGWVLTDAGHALLVHAETIESALLAATEGAAGGGGRLSGTLRIATPDGFGAFILVPNLADLAHQNPELDIEIVTATRHDMLATRGFDVAVTLDRPSPRSVDISHLADYRLGLYATPGYLQNHPHINHVLDLHHHTLIGYVDSVLDVPALRFLNEVLPGHRTHVQTNNITGQWNATAAGLGIAALPQYIGDPDPRLVRVLADDVSVQRRYWLIVPCELQRLARVRAAVATLRKICAEHPDLSAAPADFDSTSRQAHPRDTPLPTTSLPRPAKRRDELT